jgi:uncharacterized protein YndB with AHSA1/START domain
MTAAKQPAPTVVVRRVIPFPRERVFDAWLDPEKLARFMHPSGTWHATVETDPRVGGRFRIVMFHSAGASQGVVHTGEYLLIDRPSRLSFSWISVNTDNRATTVVIEFLDRPGGTEVILTHTQLPPKQVEGHRKGWSDILAGLATIETA